MVELFPVRGWHADPGSVDPDFVVCPVYDTLSESEQVRFGSRRFNAARFVPRPHGMPLDAFLLTAVGNLGEALHSGAYVQDPKPSFYVYGIRYQPPPDITETILPSQRRSEYLLLGLVGVLDLDRVAHGQVALHERTFSDRVDERVALVNATGMNFAPIMAGYTSSEHHLNDRLESFLGIDRRKLEFESARTPLVSARLDGTTHLLWGIDDVDTIRAIQTDLRDSRLLILDGHHRYTAAAKRHFEGERTMPLVMLVEGGDKALQVLPWDRVLPGDVVPPNVVEKEVRSDFGDVRRLDGPASVEATITELLAMTADRRRGFLVWANGSSFEVPGPSSADVGADFDLLHSFLEEKLGLDPHDLEFVRSPRQAIERATASEDSPAGTAFLVPGLTERGIEERAFGAGRLMAQKTTMFLPKVAEGVLFAPANGLD